MSRLLSFEPARTRLLKSRRARLLGAMSLTAFVAACGSSDSGESTDSTTTDPTVFDTVDVSLRAGGTQALMQNGDGDGVLNEATDTAGLVVESGAGDDTITTGSGSDDIWAGLGADIINAGAGDDFIFVLGTTFKNYEDSDIDAQFNAPGQALFDESELNGRSISDISAGEVIDGGAGNDTLITKGAVDLSAITLQNVENIFSEGQLTLDIGQLSGHGGEVSDISGGLYDGLVTGGDSIHVKLVDEASPVTLDLSSLSLAKVQFITLGANITLEIEDASELSAAGIFGVYGDGALNVTRATVGGNDLNGFEVSRSVTVLANGVEDTNDLGASNGFSTTSLTSQSGTPTVLALEDAAYLYPSPESGLDAAAALISADAYDAQEDLSPPNLLADTFWG